MTTLSVPEIKFEAYPKTPRFFESPVLVTEKVDGTNATIFINEDGEVFAGSRSRWITPEQDNFGFARWVAENAEPLRELLGHGWHRGEWHGLGIQRGYGLKEKRFALFNVNRWSPELCKDVPQLTTVPVLARSSSEFLDVALQEAILDLKENGSRVNAGFDKPEGVVLYHERANQVFKVPFDK